MKKSLFLLIFVFILANNTNSQVSDFNHIDFRKADEIALKYKNETLKNLPKLAYKLTSNLSTDVEKFRAIYMWICTNISGDLGMYLKNKRKRSKYRSDKIKLKLWNKSLRKKMFAKLLKDKKTVCTGYSYLLKELSRFANINCIVVDGFGRTSSTDVEKLNDPNHSWNAVHLNGKWYLCDATWASGKSNPETNKFNFQFRKGYFLTQPELFVKNHFPLDQKWLLTSKKKTTFKEFLEGPVIYSEAFKHLSLSSAPTKMHHTIQKEEKTTFKYKMNAPIDSSEISLLISNGVSDKIVKPTIVTNDTEFLIFEYQFTKKGFYDIHVIAYNDVLMTYTFDVKK